MIKSFDSEAVRMIANFTKLPRREQSLPLGKTEAETDGVSCCQTAGGLPSALSGSDATLCLCSPASH